MTTTFLNPPPHLLNSSPLRLRRSLAPQWTKYILNSAAFWYTQWTNYFLTTSPPQLLTSSPPQLIFSLLTFSLLTFSLLTFSTPHLLNSAALWRPRWSKHSSVALQVAPTMVFGAPSGPITALWRSLAIFSGKLLCSLAPLAETPTKWIIIYYLHQMQIIRFYFKISGTK